MNKFSTLNHQKFFPEQETLHKICDEKYLEVEEISRFIENYNTIDLLKIASSLRNKNNPKTITYSRKVFINLINLCKDSCSYCTYKKEPTDMEAVMLSPSQAIAIAELGKKAR